MSHPGNDQIVDQMADAVAAMNGIEAAYFFLPPDKRPELDAFINHIGQEIDRARLEISSGDIETEGVKHAAERLLKLSNYLYNHFQE